MFMGSNPTKELKNKIILKKATWIEMEFTAAAFTWIEIFNYPSIFIRPVGFVILLSVMFLNMSPPPLLYGIYSCLFYKIIMGGGIYTWIINYKSLKLSIPAFVTLLLVCILSSNTNTNMNSTSGIKIAADKLVQKSEHWSFNFFLGTFTPLLLGFLSGPIFQKIRKIEKEYKDK